MIDEDSLEDLADEISDFTPPAPKLETATLSISGGSGDWKAVSYTHLTLPTILRV